MRLIDADALKANVPETRADIFEDCRRCTTLMDWEVKELVDKQPTITAPRWHRVEEPPKGYGAFAACCVYDGKIYWFKAIYLDGKWMREMDGVELPVNYWMEIPQPPKEDA